MPYHDTIEEDIERAKKIIKDGGPTEFDIDFFNISTILTPESKQRFIENMGIILGKDVWVAYQLLKSFVTEIESYRHNSLNDLRYRCNQLQADNEVLRQDIKHLQEEKRAQYSQLRIVRETADLATGIKRVEGDERQPGALGAVRVLARRYTEMKKRLEFALEAQKLSGEQ